MSDKNYYDILGIPKDADTGRIKAAYRDLALKYHPDRNRDTPEAAEKMSALNEAYAVLSNETKRRDYDRFTRQYGAGGYSQFRQSYSNQDIFSGTDIHQVFEELAKSFGFRNFEEISKEFHHKNNAFEFKKANVHFKGFFFSGRMDPARAASKIKGPGILGRALGALVNNISKGQFPLRGQNLYDTIRISPDLAANGGPYAYYHKRRDKKLVVKIPAGTRQGQKIRLGGMGQKGSGTPGDLFLKVETRSSILDTIRRVLPF